MAVIAFEDIEAKPKKSGVPSFDDIAAYSPPEPKPQETIVQPTPYQPQVITPDMLRQGVQPQKGDIVTGEPMLVGKLPEDFPRPIQQEMRQYKGFWDELGRSFISGSLNVVAGGLGTLASVCVFPTVKRWNWKVLRRSWHFMKWTTSKASFSWTI